MKICIVYALTGGGHIAVTRALQEAFAKSSPEVEIVTCNIFQEFGGRLMGKPEASYKFFIENLPHLHGANMRFTSLPGISHTFTEVYWQMFRESALNFYAAHPADLYINTYPLCTTPLANARRELGLTAKLVNMVTDLSYMIPMWFNPLVDLNLLPTQESYDNGLKYFKDYAERVEVLGLPVSQRFYEPYEQTAVRRELGLQELPTVLVFGGGEGMSKSLKVAQRLDSDLEGVQIVFAAGKDSKLRTEAEAYGWRNQVTVIGWTDQFHRYVQAADVVASKAGSIIIAECIAAGKQIALYDLIPGQEEGNPQYVEAHGYGIYARNLRKLSGQVQQLLERSHSQQRDLTNWGERVAARVLSELTQG